MASVMNYKLHGDSHKSYNDIKTKTVGTRSKLGEVKGVRRTRHRNTPKHQTNNHGAKVADSKTAMHQIKMPTDFVPIFFSFFVQNMDFPEKIKRELSNKKVSNKNAQSTQL